MTHCVHYDSVTFLILNRHFCVPVSQLILPISTLLRILFRRFAISSSDIEGYFVVVFGAVTFDKPLLFPDDLFYAIVGR